MLLSPFALWAALAVLTHGLPSQTTPAISLLERADEDASDLSWIRTWTSVGDSYSAGIGSGDKNGGWGDWLCSRYDQSFPRILNDDERLGNSDGRIFNYWPCSGAKADAVTKQINALQDASQDLITITAGGDDALFGDILNECVYQWLSDADPLNSLCDGKLDEAQKVIDSDGFHSKLDDLITSAKNKLLYNGQVLYIGYAQFFGQETSQCDDVTWAYWYEIGKREYLTQDKRKRMNELVVNINKALSDAVDRAGDHVTFIDYDKYYVASGGRFCEDGYVETSPNRAGLLFYEWDTDDSADETDGLTAQEAGSPQDFTPSVVMNGTREAMINDYVRQTLANNPSWADDVASAQGDAPSVDTVQATDDQILRGYSSSVVPDGYGRVFHPRPNGHQLIANLVLYHIGANYAQRINQDFPQEEVTSDTCTPTTNNVDPSNLPTLPCSVPQPTETGKFYLFTESYRSCSEGGLCSDAQLFAGLATEDDWNAGCDFFTGTAADLFSVNEVNPNNPYPPNVNFTIDETGAYCNTNPLTFDLQCDGSWIVSGAGQGGISHCTTDSLPETPTATCDTATFDGQATAVLACTGAICQAPPS